MTKRIDEVLSSMLQEMNKTHIEALPDDIPQCSECGGLGYVRYSVDYTDVKFGKMFRCPNPNCPAIRKQLSEQTQKVAAYSDWQKYYSAWTFDSFKRLIGKRWEGKRGAYALAKSFAIANGVDFTLEEAAQAVWKTSWPSDDKDERKSCSVVLTGDVGRGKTSLAIAATNELLKRHQSAVFIRMRELIRRLQEPYQKNWEGETSGNRVHFYSSVPYLIIDEFGIKNYTDDRLELVESVIRDRDRQGLPFMATTNFNIEQFKEHWSLQISDIVQKAHWVEVSGAKLRETREKVEVW